MNTRIYSKSSFNEVLDETLYQAYQDGIRSIDYLLLFPVNEQEKDHLITQVKNYNVVLDAKWRFGTVMFTAYIKH